MLFLEKKKIPNQTNIGYLSKIKDKEVSKELQY